MSETRDPTSTVKKLLKMHNTIETFRAENDRLREALEKIAEANWLDDPHEARRITRAALAKEAGE